MTGYLHAEGDTPGEQDGAADGASQELRKGKGDILLFRKSRMSPLWARAVRAILKATCEP